MSAHTYWLKRIRDVNNLIDDEKGTKVIQYVYLLIIDEEGTEVVRDLRYVLKEWLVSCERVDFEDPFEFTFEVENTKNRIDEVVIRLSSTEGIIVNLDVLVEWYLEHRVKVGLRRLIVEDLKEATDEA